MLISPRPPPPYLPIYPEEDRANIQHAYELALDDWCRELNRALLLNVATVICAFVGVIVAALFAPGIVVNAISILAK